MEIYDINLFCKINFVKHTKNSDTLAYVVSEYFISFSLIINSLYF